MYVVYNIDTNIVAYTSFLIQAEWRFCDRYICNSNNNHSSTNKNKNSSCIYTHDGSIESLLLLSRSRGV